MKAKKEESGEVKIRLNLNFEESFKHRVDKMAKDENTSLRGIIRRAVVCLEMILKHRNSGGRIIFRHEDGSEETVRFL